MKQYPLHPHCHAVHKPLMNKMLAERTIRSTCYEEDLLEWTKLGPRPKIDIENARLVREGYRLVTIVDLFMRNYPRGAGTAGDDRLRTLYAACYTLKLLQHRKNNYGYAPKLSEAQQRYIATLPADGDSTSVKPGTDATEGVLYSLGLISGDIGTWWLTDRGLYFAPSLRLSLGNKMLNRALDAVDEARETNRIARDKAEAELLAAAVDRILHLDRRDPKEFLRHAHTISGVFA